MSGALAVLGAATVPEPTDLDVLRDAHNREVIELWLTTYGQYVPTRVRLDEEVKGTNPNKPESRANQNLRWLEALTDPEVLASHYHIRELVYRALPVLNPDYATVLDLVYLDDLADASLPARWKSQCSANADEDTPPANPGSARRYHAAYVGAMGEMVERSRQRVLVIPYPENAKSYIEESARQRRIARRVYLQVFEDMGDHARAKERAARASGYSIRSVERVLARHRVSTEAALAK